MSSLLRKAGSCNSVFRHSDVVHHANTTVENFEHLVDLHPSRAVAVVENGVANHDSALGIDESDIEGT
jgi:hypothetical protein